MSQIGDHELILIGGLLLAAGIAAAKVADRVRVPGLLLFLGLGMLAGSEGIGGVEFDDAELTRTLGTIGLVLILFEGGLSAGWSAIRPVIGTAVSLATAGTVITALITGLAAILLFDLGTLEGLIIGSAVAATDSAAIFAVLRGSRLRRRLASALEGESGMNDPVALLLVTGFIDWIELPDYGALDMAAALVAKLALGLATGLLIGLAARWAVRNLDFPTTGLYPVASIATAALAYGVPELLHGSGFLSVYIAALVLGTGWLPAKRTTIAFHEGLAWVSQISLFFLLGLLVFPSQLLDVAAEGLLLSAALMFVARPLAAVVCSAFGPFEIRERLMLGWAGLRGAIPIWLATFPVIAGVGRQRADLQLGLLRRRHLDPDPGGELRGARAAARRHRRRAGVARAGDRDRDDPPARGRIAGLASPRGRRGGRTPDQGPRAAARGAGQPPGPRRGGDPAPRLDRDRGR